MTMMARRGKPGLHCGTVRRNLYSERGVVMYPATFRELTCSADEAAEDGGHA